MRVDQAGNSPQTNEIADRVKVTHTRQPKGTHQAHESRESSTRETSGESKAEISPRAKEFAHAKEVAGRAPDVREEKIAALKARIAGGHYDVDADAVADRMVDEHLKMSGMS